MQKIKHNWGKVEAMRLTIYTFLCFLILTLILVSQSFAMEPFYKGHWGMTPEQVADEYDGIAPSYVDRDVYATCFTYVGLTINDYACETAYFFVNDDGDTYRLRNVWVGFAFNELGLEECESFAAELRDMIEREIEPDKARYKRFDGQPAEAAKNDQKWLVCWLSGTDCISLDYTWDDSGGNGYDLLVDLNFYDITHHEYEYYYKQRLAGLKFSNMK